MTQLDVARNYNAIVDMMLVYRRARIRDCSLSTFLLFIFVILLPINVCHAEQSLVFPLHYSDDQAFYRNVFMTPLGRRILDENYGSQITFDRFHLTGYDDGFFFEKHKLMIVNDSSQGGSVALIACILNGDEAIEFSRRLVRAEVLEDEMLHPYGFATLRVSGTITLYEDGPNQQPRVILAIDPCHVEGLVRHGKVDTYSRIVAPIRRWSQYHDAKIPQIEAVAPFYEYYEYNYR